uniref:Tetratricopeptide repeat protein 38 n=2 Tax=Hirondellea gigas TaxID=1518452 RepID=A0A6A7FY56_9CRUS
MRSSFVNRFLRLQRCPLRLRRRWLTTSPSSHSAASVLQRATTANGVALSTSSPEAAKAYDLTVECLLGLKGDPFLGLNVAKKYDPEFGMPHILEGMLKMSSTGVPFLNSPIATAKKFDSTNEVLKCIEKAEKCVLDDRETHHLNALKSWSNGRLHEATHHLELALLINPRDLVATRHAHDTYFFIGDAVNLRDSIARVLPSHSPGESGRSRLLGMFGFGLEECNEYGRSRKASHECLDEIPSDIWGTHALAHCFEMNDDIESGIDFLSSTEKDWKHCDWLSVHNYWHWCLYLTRLEKYAQIFDLYDEKINPEKSELMLDIVDASSLLWRLSLRGIDVGNRWETLSSIASKFSSTHVTSFNDIHLMMTLCGVGDVDEQNDFLDSLERVVENEADNSEYAQTTRRFGLPICKALQFFVNEDYGQCVKLLLNTRQGLHKIGGSHAQRDVFYQTLLESSRRMDNTNLTQSLENEKNRAVLV